MKIALIAAVSTLPAITILAAKPDAAPPLWREMQTAVLVTQNVQTVADLLQRGADINAPIGCGTFSAMDGAVSTQDVVMLKFLLAHGAKPHSRNLADAASAINDQNSLEMVNALLAAGCDPNSTDVNGPTPLYWATWREHTEVVAKLLSQHGIKVNAQNWDDHETALMCAAGKGSREIIDSLIKAGADPSMRDVGGKTAADYALAEIKARQDIIAMLQLATPPTKPASLKISSRAD